MNKFEGTRNLIAFLDLAEARSATVEYEGAPPNRRLQFTQGGLTVRWLEVYDQIQYESKRGSLENDETVRLIFNENVLADPDLLKIIDWMKETSKDWLTRPIVHCSNVEVRRNEGTNTLVFSWKEDEK